MIPAILLTVSTVAFGQFALYYWRAMIFGVAAHEISDRTRIAAGITSTTLGAKDLRSILMLNNVWPVLHGSRNSFRCVRSYYAVMEKLGRMIPAVSSWADGEMATCSRYVAVLMDQQLDRNIACAAQLRGI